MGYLPILSPRRGHLNCDSCLAVNLNQASDTVEWLRLWMADRVIVDVAMSMSAVAEYKSQCT